MPASSGAGSVRQFAPLRAICDPNSSATRRNTAWRFDPLRAVGTQGPRLSSVSAKSHPTRRNGAGPAGALLAPGRDVSFDNTLWFAQTCTAKLQVAAFVMRLRRDGEVYAGRGGYSPPRALLSTDASEASGWQDAQ